MKKTIFLLFACLAFSVSLTANAEAYYLIGEFNQWNQEAMIPFVAKSDGSFVLTRTLKGAFKVKDDAGNWYGGYTGNDTYYWLTTSNPSVNLCDGANLYLDGESATYTLTIANGILTATGFGTPPRPHDPKAEDWMDWGVITWEEDGEIQSFCAGSMFQFGFQREFHADYQLVADDWSIDIEENGGIYTVLDESKVTYSIYTDYDKILTFLPEDFTVTYYDEDGNPVEFCDIPEPTTEIPYGYLGESNSFFEMGDIMFDRPKFCNDVEGQEPFFKYRIGIQVHYTVNGVKSSSNIVYLYPFDEYPEIPVLKGDVNLDGKVDVTDVNILVNIVLGKDSADNYDGRAYITEGDTVVDVSDINAVVNIVLGKTE